MGILLEKEPQSRLINPDWRDWPMIIPNFTSRKLFALTTQYFLLGDFGQKWLSYKLNDIIIGKCKLITQIMGIKLNSEAEETNQTRINF